MKSRAVRARLKQGPGLSLVLYCTSGILAELGLGLAEKTIIIFPAPFNPQILPTWYCRRTGSSYNVQVQPQPQRVQLRSNNSVEHVPVYLVPALSTVGPILRPRSGSEIYLVSSVVSYSVALEINQSTSTLVALLRAHRSPIFRPKP